MQNESETIKDLSVDMGTLRLSYPVYETAPDVGVPYNASPSDGELRAAAYAKAPAFGPAAPFTATQTAPSWNLFGCKRINARRRLERVFRTSTKCLVVTGRR